MMILYLIISFALLFVPMFFKEHLVNKGYANTQFMSFEYTTVLRAIAILMVMQQHLVGFILGSRVFTPFGGAGVAIFLIISGYGLTMSAKRKGLGEFWMKKVVRVFIPWLIVWTAITLLHWNSFSSFSSISSLLLINSTNWYLQYLLICYLIFYVSNKCFYKWRWLLMVCFFILSFVLWENIQAEQSCSFLIGCLIAEKRKLFKLIVNHIRLISVLSLFVCISFLALKQLNIIRSLMENISLFDHALNMIMKTSLAIFVMMLVRLLWPHINRRLTMFIGKISYELYLVHLFIVIDYCKMICNMPLVSIFVFIVCSFILSYLLYILDNKILAFYKKMK